jgi:hypothetical protein
MLPVGAIPPLWGNLCPSYTIHFSRCKLEIMVVNHEALDEREPMLGLDYNSIFSGILRTWS